MNPINIERNGVRLCIAPDANDRPRLCYARLAEGAALRDPDVGRGLFFLQGESGDQIHVPSLGAKHHMSPPGTDFFYRSHHWADTPGGQTLTLRLEWERIEAELRWRFFDDVAAVRFEVTLRNLGDAPFALNAFAPVLLHDLFRGGPMQWDRQSRIHLPHNARYGELQWRAYRPPELGLSAVRTNSTKRIFQSNTGSWSTKEALPMGVFTAYINCLDGDPTTGKERPFIAAADEVGCEVYCIDAGWFAPLDQNWWPAIGEWQPSGDRFEGGIEGILGEIREAVPFWLLGLPLHRGTTWALGLRGEKRIFLAVWTLGNHANLQEAIAKLGQAEPLFPGKRGSAAPRGPTAALFQL